MNKRSTKGGANLPGNSINKIENTSEGKYLFTLNGIDTEKIDQKYGINAHIDKIEKLPRYTTKLVDLTLDKNTPEIISFLDESKRIHKCNVSMIDFKSGRSIQLLRYNCFWCRHAFDSQPLGIPISYVCKKAIKTYYSEISKDTYTISENITNDRCDHIDDPRITVNNEEYYETDSVVCSWDCMAAFIENHKHDKRYDKSKSLMLKMYNDVMGTVAEVIKPAPHWSQLIEYGGWRSIVDFRAGFNKTEYEYHGVHKMPQFKSIAHLFEEKIKF
jgi:hypothetical protein